MSTHRHTIGREPIYPDRVRRIGPRGFAYVPHPFLRDGYYASLTPDEVALYLLLVLVGDRNGVSYYHYDSLCSLLQVSLERYLAARDGLLSKDLVAFDGTRIQVLELPPRPVIRPAASLATAEARERSDSATIRGAILRALATGPDDTK